MFRQRVRQGRRYARQIRVNRDFSRTGLGQDFSAEFGCATNLLWQAKRQHIRQLRHISTRCKFGGNARFSATADGDRDRITVGDTLQCVTRRRTRTGKRSALHTVFGKGDHAGQVGDSRADSGLGCGAQQSVFTVYFDYISAGNNGDRDSQIELAEPINCDHFCKAAHAIGQWTFPQKFCDFFGARIGRKINRNHAGFIGKIGNHNRAALYRGVKDFCRFNGQPKFGVVKTHLTIDVFGSGPVIVIAKINLFNRGTGRKSATFAMMKRKLIELAFDREISCAHFPCLQRALKVASSLPNAVRQIIAHSDRFHARKFPFDIERARAFLFSSARSACPKP